MIAAIKKNAHENALNRLESQFPYSESACYDLNQEKLWKTIKENHSKYEYKRINIKRYEQKEDSQKDKTNT